jgi:PTH1 family peptidyl-tRNA hydrolase
VVDALAEAYGGTWKEDRSFEALVSKITIAERLILLVKPQTFMNRSGRSLAALARFYKVLPEAFAVVHDDITLALSRLKVTLQGSAGGHNGVESVLQQLGVGFARFRIGIGDKPHPEMDLADYVLGHFTAAEHAVLMARIPEFVRGLTVLVDKGAEDAMNLLNTKETTTITHS